jgi:alpha-L-arabinofuranosidase
LKINRDNPGSIPYIQIVMKKPTKQTKAVKAVKAVKAATAKAKAKTSVAAPVVTIHQKERKDVSVTFRLSAQVKEALISHAFSNGYDGNMSRAANAILANILL